MKRVLAILLALAMVCCFAACAKAPETPTEEPSKEEVTVKQLEKTEIVLDLAAGYPGGEPALTNNSAYDTYTVNA